MKSQLKMFQTRNYRNLFTSAAPLCFYLKLLGLFPASFKGSIRSGMILVCAGGKAYSVSVMIFWLMTMTFISLQPSENQGFKDFSAMVIKSFRYSTILGSFGILVAMIYHYRKFDGTLEILQLLHGFDEKVNTSQFNPRPSMHNTI